MSTLGGQLRNWRSFSPARFNPSPINNGYTCAPLIKVPKFTIRSDLHVEDALEKNGLEHYFTENADFSGATNARLQDFTHKSSFIHKTFIKTDECGTEASAVSYKTYHDYASMAPPKIPVKYVYKNFHANRPFLYAIVSRKQHVLFIGTVMDVDEKIEAEFEDTDVDENTNQI